MVWLTKDENYKIGGCQDCSIKFGKVEIKQMITIINVFFIESITIFSEITRNMNDMNIFDYGIFVQLRYIVTLTDGFNARSHFCTIHNS